MARYVDQSKSGQDFALGIDSAAAATHTLSRANGTSLEPRVVRLLGRLNILPPPQAGNVRGLLQALSVSGYPLVLNPGPGTTTNVLAGSAVPGFPGRAMDPVAVVDLTNLIGTYAAPNTPVELTWRWSSALALAGHIGCDLPPPEQVADIVRVLAAGDVYGEPNFALGGGEFQQGTANTAQVCSVSYKSPRAMVLERMIVDSFRDDGADIISGNVKLSAFRIAGENILATSRSVDCLSLSPYATDEDGLAIGIQVGTDDLIELDFTIEALGAGVSAIIQHGFFTS